MNRDRGNLPPDLLHTSKYLSIVVFAPSHMRNVRMRSHKPHPLSPRIYCLSPSLCSLSPDDEDTWRGVETLG